MAHWIGAFCALATVFAPYHAARAESTPAAPAGEGSVGPAAPLPPLAPLPQLSEVQALGLLQERSLALVGARYELGASRARTIAAGVMPNPELSLGAAFLLHGPITGGREEFGISIEQPLPITGVVGARSRTAEALESAAERAFVARAWQLGCETRELYLAVQVARERKTLYVDSVVAMRKLEEILEVRAKAGANPAYDKLRIQVEVRKLEARVTQADNELQLARAELAKVIGETDAESTTAADVEPLRVPVAPAHTLVEALARALGRPDLQAARLRKSGAELAIEATRKEYLPIPRLSVGYNIATAVPTDTGTTAGGMLSAGLALPLPFFDRGQGTIDGKRFDARREQAQSEQLEREIRIDVATADRVYRAQLAAYTTYRATALEDAAKMRGIAQFSYREGRATVLELVDAFNAYREAQERAIDLQGDALLKGQRLQRVIGPKSTPQ
jgi:outer membrane protein, heavy metal efflux system